MRSVNGSGLGDPRPGDGHIPVGGPQVFILGSQFLHAGPSRRHQAGNGGLLFSEPVEREFQSQPPGEGEDRGHPVIFDFGRLGPVPNDAQLTAGGGVTRQPVQRDEMFILSS